VTNFIRQGDGRFLLVKLAKFSHLYKNIKQTAEKVRQGDIILDLSSMEKRPYLSNDKEFVAAAIQRIVQWRLYFRDLGHWPAPLAARRDRFMAELSRLPWVVEYCTLHFLVSGGGVGKILLSVLSSCVYGLRVRGRLSVSLQ
jgi:hypothetical protein